MITRILNSLKNVCNFIVKLFVRCLNFVKNIFSFFKDPKKRKELQRNKNAVAVSIKQKLHDGDYNVVDCLFDKQKEEIIATEEGDIQELEAKELDKETQDMFGEKEMIVLK